MYDGTTDPQDHVAQYKQKMWQLLIPWELIEPTMCKSFGATLSGPALQWLINLKQGTIASFSSLVNKYYQQFATSRELNKQSSDLYRVVQKQNEITRQYWDKFNREMVSIKNCDHSTAIEAFCKGLNYRSRLYYELTRYPCSSFEKVRTRAMAEVRGEEDEHDRSWVERRPSRNSGNQSFNNQSSRNRQGNWQSRRNNVNSVSEPGASEGPSRPAIEYYPNVILYGFDTDAVRIVNALKDIGPPVRWPRKSDKPEHQKDKSKLCDYHGDHGHMTDECNSLKREVAWLLKKGYLKYLLGKKGKRPEIKQEVLSGPPSSPTPSIVIQAISGGSSISGLTYSSAKRISRVGTSASSIPQTYPSNEEKKLDDMVVVFDESRFNEPEHHDCLVISLHVGHYKMKRVLVDNGSSTNIIFKDALDQAGFKESDIIKKSTVLVGFNGEPMNSLGEIQLPTLLKGVNMMQKFYVIDCKTAYNVIVGTPWIHKMKAIPSTYHQLLKFLSPWGVAVVEEDKKQARECYQLALKPHGPAI
ncbi:uncharacterized protein LOC110721237 [Chenopodium quinoa]|uniref:uncharacterized protein LOC110721237 n=1 Tax=Chenopodium quinoa TaxID=63459 RepID=UPI000B781E7B|nr:uncharacterized protein LOC110721237 [Chenopodium quinoa]